MEPDAEAHTEQPNKSPTNPALQNTIYLKTRSLNVMTITHIDFCNALVYSTERVRRRSRNSRNSPLNKYVAVQKFC